MHQQVATMRHNFILWIERNIGHFSNLFRRLMSSYYPLPQRAIDDSNGAGTVDIDVVFCGDQLFVETWLNHVLPFGNVNLCCLECLAYRSRLRQNRPLNTPVVQANQTLITRRLRIWLSTLRHSGVHQ